MTSAPVRALTPTAQVEISDAETVDMRRLDIQRRAILRDCERLEARLGDLRRSRNERRKLGPNLAPYRTKLKTELADKRSQVRGIGVKLKQARRRRAVLLADGISRPKSVTELVAGLYRVFMDAVDPEEWNETERSLMRTARDFVQNGAMP